LAFCIAMDTTSMVIRIAARTVTLRCRDGLSHFKRTPTDTVTTRGMATPTGL
jgi:hypothetical protein